MLAMCRTFATQGDYVINIKTGEIRRVVAVGNEAEAFIDEPPFFAEDFIEYWPLEDYYVLEKIADIYFDGHFDEAGR